MIYVKNEKQARKQDLFIFTGKAMDFNKIHYFRRQKPSISRGFSVELRIFR